MSDWIKEVVHAHQSRPDASQLEGVSECERFRMATTWACDYFEPLLEDGQFIFGETNFWQTLALRMPGVEFQDDDHGTYVSVTESAAERLVEIAECKPEVFDFCVSVVACAVSAGIEVPDGLKDFAVDVLEGRRTRPKHGHRPRKNDWVDKFLILRVAEMLSVSFSLTKTRNEESNRKTSSSDAVAEALTVCGRATKYRDVWRIVTHPDNDRFRREVHALLNHNDF